MRTPTLSEWDNLNEQQQLEHAQQLLRVLPPEFAIENLQRHALGGASHVAASFTGAGVRWVLVPGGPARLGYNRKIAPSFSPSAIAALNDIETELGVTWATYLDQMLTPWRTVGVRSFLMEVVPRRICETLLSEREVSAVRSGGHSRPDLLTDVENGVERTWRMAEGKTATQVRAEVEAEGFALPTQDEWEYACRAGTSTLFRWGDSFPTFDEGLGEYDFDPRNEPNALGLLMPGRTYDWEVCEEAGVFRGGDGGEATCGGSPDAACWIALASAFLAPGVEDTFRSAKLSNPIVRRIFRLE